MDSISLLNITSDSLPPLFSITLSPELNGSAGVSSVGNLPVDWLSGNRMHFAADSGLFEAPDFLAVTASE